MLEFSEIAAKCTRHANIYVQNKENWDNLREEKKDCILRNHANNTLKP